MTATICDAHGNMITSGLQPSAISDEAAQAAVRIAKERGETVYLTDDDGEWAVGPDGDFESVDA